jgi:predicted AlkP superfamily phosphohydrolase/phosphomutase
VFEVGDDIATSIRDWLRRIMYELAGAWVPGRCEREATRVAASSVRTGRNRQEATRMHGTGDSQTTASAAREHGRPRVMLIGLDAADAGILLQGSETDDFPTLRSLRDRGAWGIVASPRGFGSGAVWPSFATGVSPAKHRRYFYRQVGPGSYSAQKFEAEHFAVAPIWEAIAANGRRIAVLDVPKVGVSTDIDGVIAVDWISHGPVYQHMRTWPPEFGKELTERFGVNPLRKCDLPGGRNADQMDHFMAQMRQRIEQRERATRHLWSEGYDLVVSVFAEPHCVGHQAWHIHDDEHPMHDPISRVRLGDPVLAAYREIDAAIGRMIEDLDDDATVIVFSGTGMGPNFTGNHILDKVLRAFEDRRPTVSADLTDRTRMYLKRVLPTELRRRGRKLKHRIEEQASVGDRSRRPCFVVPHNDIAGAVRLNIVGREPNGVLERGDVDDYVARLTTDLLSLRNADTGSQVVVDVVRVSDEHEGDWIDHMPDLFVLWNRTDPIDRVVSDRIGTLEYVHRGNRTGDHSPDNIFFAVGPQVRPGLTNGVRLYDFAATICELLGVPAPATDGSPIEALTAFAATRPTGPDPFAPI